jgi:micrococcal nuclease
LYEYDAQVIRWVDGDTVDLLVSLGFGTSWESRFRLYGIDTPERGQPGYTEATAFCMGAAPVGAEVRIRSCRPEMMKQDKYGRWLAVITPQFATASVNDSLINAGLAVPYFGGTKGTP